MTLPRLILLSVLGGLSWWELAVIWMAVGA